MFYNLGLTFNNFNNSSLFSIEEKIGLKTRFAYSRDKSRINESEILQKSHDSVVAGSNFFRFIKLPENKQLYNKKVLLIFGRIRYMEMAAAVINKLLNFTITFHMMH